MECTLCLGHPVYGRAASLKVTVYFCYCLQGTDIIICDGVYVLLYFLQGTDINNGGLYVMVFMFCYIFYRVLTLIMVDYM